MKTKIITFVVVIFAIWLLGKIFLPLSWFILLLVLVVVVVLWFLIAGIKNIPAIKEFLERYDK